MALVTHGRGMALAGRRMDAVPLALAGVILGAAVLRFSSLTSQSYWFDEVVFTAVPVKASFWDMLSAVRAHQSEPPLYFVMAWPWARVFGESEAGLRSLSALFGVLTVP